METSLLATKLFVPAARHGLVPRPRLMDLLPAVLCPGLVLVSAPAGFGKTTLLAEWTRQNEPTVPTAWISLDEGDNDPVRFWDYFIAALRTLRPTAGETASAMLHSPQPYSTESVLTALINDITAVAEDFAIVLDDYHFVKSGPIHAGITFLLDHLPPKMHLIIATRADPPLPLARFRGRGTMLEIGADDLRFTLEEATALLTELQKAELAAADVGALNARTEGWAVGLMMAALSMGKHKDIPGFIASFTGSHRHVMDYLIEEVLRQQPPSIQDFLLKTSVLERLTAPLCNSLTGHSSSQEMLTRLESSLGGFLVPLDELRQWYRYHHLFAELLRHQLGLTSGAEQVNQLRQMASQWYEANGFPDDAIRHALAARDWPRAMRLLYDPDEKRIKIGETVTLLNWLKAVPEEVLRTHRQLYCQFAQVLINAGDLEAAEAVLNYLRQSEDDDDLRGEIAVLEASIASSRREYQRTLELSRKALSLLAPDNLRARSVAAYTLGQIIWDKGFFEEAEPLLTEAFNSARQSGYLQIAGQAVNFLSNIKWHRGNLHEAAEMLEQAIGLAEQSPAFVAPRLSLSSYYYEWNDLDKAAHHQQRLIDLCKINGSLAGMVQGYFFLAHTRLAQGEVTGAKIAMDKADQLVVNPGVPQSSVARHAAYRFMFALKQDDSAAILEWGNRVLEYANHMPPFLWHIQQRVLIARGEKAIAAQQLEALYERTTQAGMEGTSVRVIIGQALASATSAEALTFLAKALTKGQPEGHIRTFVDEGRLLAPLLRMAISRRITPEYAGKLLGIIKDEERWRGAKEDDGTVVPPPSELVSKRELEVLRLVAEGLSNRQIADRLSVGLSTAKTHVHRLFEKLNAKDRLQVVNRARELKLI